LSGSSYMCKQYHFFSEFGKPSHEVTEAVAIPQKIEAVDNLIYFENEDKMFLSTPQLF